MSLFKSLNPNMFNTKTQKDRVLKYTIFLSNEQAYEQKHWTNSSISALCTHRCAGWSFILQEQCVDEHPRGLIKAIHETNFIPHTAHYGIEINLWNVTSGLLESKRERGAQRKSTGGFSSDNTQPVPLSVPFREMKNQNTADSHTCLKGGAQCVLSNHTKKQHTHWQKTPP